MTHTAASRSLVLLAVLTAAAALAANAGASPLGGCSDADLERPFQQFGDNNQYMLVPEGDFESGTGWILTGGARIVAGNEPFAVHGPNERRSLLLSPGTSATSRPICLALALPSLRFFARATPGAIMKVETIYQDAAGTRRVAEFARFGASSSWWATPPLCFLVNAAVPVSADGTMIVSFRFTAVTGGWQIDDVYVDPRKGR
jgi:hypothetical protein